MSAARQALAERFAYVERQCDAMDAALEVLTKAGYAASLHVSATTMREFLVLFLDVHVNDRLAVSGTWTDGHGFSMLPHGKSQRNARLAVSIQLLLNEPPPL